MRPTVAEIRDCPDCRDKFRREGSALLHACASVGIEEGMTTGQTVAMYMATFHEGDHQFGTGDA